MESWSYTIKSSTVEPTSISVSPSTKTIEVGETFTPTYSLTPSNASTTVTWSSDDSSVASVDSNTGLVTGKKPERHTSMLQLQMARQIGVQLL